MAIIKKTRNNKYWQECGEKGTFLHCWWGCKLVQPLWKIVQRFLKKLKIELPYHLAILPLGIYVKEIKSVSQRYLHLHVQWSTIPRHWNNLCYHGWKNGCIHTHIHNGILFSLKKNEFFPLVITWMDLNSIMLSEIRQTEKDQHSNVKSKKNCQTHRNRK